MNLTDGQRQIRCEFTRSLPPRTDCDGITRHFKEKRKSRFRAPNAVQTVVPVHFFPGPVATSGSNLHFLCLNFLGIESKVYLILEFLYVTYGDTNLVFYLDRKEWTGNTDLEPKEIFTGFRLISLNQLPLERFLEAEDPNQLIFGILSNFGEITEDDGIQMLINDLHRKSVNAIEYRKHLEELKILAEIGSLRVPLEKIVEDMPIEVDTTQFSEYKLGYSRGREAGIKEARRQERIKVILKLIADREITFAKAREILAVSEAQLRSYISGEA